MHSSPAWGFFEPAEVSRDGKKVKKAVKLAYAGGTSNLINQLQGKHVEIYKRIFVESSFSKLSKFKKQTTPLCFQQRRPVLLAM